MVLTTDSCLSKIDSIYGKQNKSLTFNFISVSKEMVRVNNTGLLLFNIVYTSYFYCYTFFKCGSKRLLSLKRGHLPLMQNIAILTRKTQKLIL